MTASDDSAHLLGGEWAPVTTAMTFVEGDLEGVVDGFLSWRGRSLLEQTGHALKVRPVKGDLATLLGSLEPLYSSGSRRYLFMPTAAASPWTAYFDNDRRGTEPNAPLVAYATRGRRVAAIFSSEQTYDPNTNQGFYGVRRLQTSWPDPDDQRGLNGRTIGVQVNDRGRWESMESGDPLPFEDTSTYTARRKQDRVTQPLLRQYAAALGLRPFDEDFYAPDGNGILVEHTEPPVPESREFTLAEVRSGLPFEQIGRPAR